MQSKEVLNQLSPYQQGKQTDDIKKEFNLQKIVKLASNENPYGYSKTLQGEFLSLNHEFNIYPDGHTADLRSALAKKFNIVEDQLVFGSGSDEIIQMICRAYLYPGASTVMPDPTFPQFKHNALIEGAEVKGIPTIDGHHDLNGMLGAIDDQTTVVWLCTPDNPTGTIIRKDEFKDFMDQCPKDVLVVLDQAYFEFVEKENRLNDMENLAKYDNLIILRTFSKAYGLAGIRVGYAITHGDIARKLNIVRGPFNTTSIAQKAALMALSDQDFIDDTVAKNNKVKTSFQQFLDEIGWPYYESHTNFILISTPISGIEVFNYLLERGYIIRPGDILGYPNTIRVTIGTEEQMEELQRLLKELDQVQKGK